jgi:hypothetical protein
MTKWRKYAGSDSSKLQGDLNFAFDQRESEVNLHKVVGSINGRSSINNAHFISIRVQFLKFFSSKTSWPNELKLDGKQLWNYLKKNI